MTVHDYWRVLLRRKWIVLLCATAATLLAAAQVTLQVPRYRAEAQLILLAPSNESVFGDAAPGNRNPDRLLQNEVSVLEGELVRARVREDLGLTRDPPRASASTRDGTDVVTLRVESTNPRDAALIANAYITAYNELKTERAVARFERASDELQRGIADLEAQLADFAAEAGDEGASTDPDIVAKQRALIDRQEVLEQTQDQLQIDAGIASVGAETVEPASVPTSPFEPTPERTGVLALLIGLFGGVCLALVADRIDRSIRSADDLAKFGVAAPVLAVVPSAPTTDVRPIASTSPMHAAVEAYRTLRTSVQFLGIERDVRVILVTSSVPAEGKTTTSANLAVVLAQTGARVVIVDADLRRPRINQVFGLEGGSGLTDVLLGAPADSSVRTVDDDLHVLAAGKLPPNPSEILSGSHMTALVDELRSRFDYVVIDSAPALAVSDAMALSRCADGVLVVVQAGKISAPQVRQTVSRLEQVDAAVLGVVLNRASRRTMSQSYGYGYGYEYGGAAGAGRGRSRAVEVG